MYKANGSERCQRQTVVDIVGTLSRSPLPGIIAANSSQLHPRENCPLCKQEPLLETSGRLCPPGDSSTANGMMSISAKKSGGILIVIALSVMICSYQQMILEYKSPFPFPQGGTDLPFMCQKFPVEAKLISLLIPLTDFSPLSYLAFLTTGQILLKSTPSINHLHRIPFSGSAFRESNLRQENSGVN